MRPIYETSQDKAREADFASWICLFWGIILVKRPDLDAMDYDVFEGSVDPIGVAEIKCRNHDFGRFPTLILSLEKFVYGASYALETGRKFLLFVRFSDCCGLYQYRRGDECKFRLESGGGRTVRTRDSGDIETVIHIPLDRIKIWHK